MPPLVIGWPAGYTRTVTPHVVYLAHHWLLLAVPAFLPAIIVVAVILYIALKDRRSGDSADGTSDGSGHRPDAVDEKRD